MSPTQIDMERKRFKNELQRISTMDKAFIQKMMTDFDKITEL